MAPSNKTKQATGAQGREASPGLEDLMSNLNLGKTEGMMYIGGKKVNRLLHINISNESNRNAGVSFAELLLVPRLAAGNM